MQTQHPSTSHQPNRSLKGTRGYALACFVWFHPPAPLSLALGIDFIQPDFIGFSIDFLKRRPSCLIQQKKR